MTLDHSTPESRFFNVKNTNESDVAANCEGLADYLENGSGPFRNYLESMQQETYKTITIGVLDASEIPDVALDENLLARVDALREHRHQEHAERVRAWIDQNPEDEAQSPFHAFKREEQ